MSRRRAQRAWAAATAAGIAALTLAPQATATFGSLPWWCVLCGPESGADAAGNVALFVPLGAALVAAGLPPRRAVLVAALGSLSVEVAQGLGIAGREATLGDLLTNVLGAALGAVAAAHWSRLRRPTPALARRLAIGAGALWLAQMALSAHLLGRDAVRGPVPPRLGTLPYTPGYGWYQGRISAVSIGGRPVTARAGTGPVIMRAPVGRIVQFALTVTGGDDRSGAVPLLFVHDTAGRGRLVVAKRGPDAVLWLRLRAARWRLRRPQLALFGALAPLRQGDASRRARVAGGVDGVTWWLTVRTAATPLDPASAPPTTTALRLDAARGWALVVPFARPAGPERHLLDVLWAGALLVPFGYWLGPSTHGPTPVGQHRRAGALAATVVGLGLAALPLVLESVVVGPAAWLSACSAVAAGWWLQTGRRRARARESP